MTEHIPVGIALDSAPDTTPAVLIFNNRRVLVTAQVSQVVDVRSHQRLIEGSIRADAVLPPEVWLNARAVLELPDSSQLDIVLTSLHLPFEAGFTHANNMKLPA